MLCLIFLIYVLFETSVTYGIEDDPNEYSDIESEKFLNNIQNSMGMCFDEIFATACGASILKRSSDENDIENQQIAIASTKLWVKLSNMVAIQEVFRKSTFTALTKKLDDISGSIVPRVIRTVFENIENTILDDSELATNYREEKSKVEGLSLSSIDLTNSNFSTLYEKNSCFKEFIVRITILLHAFGPYSVYYSLSRAILELAKTSERDQVQQIFDEAVKITAANIDLEDSRMEDKSHVSGIAKILFPTIIELIERTPNLENLFMKYGVEDINLGTERKITF